MQLAVTPAEPLINEVIGLRLTEAPPSARVQISATTTDQRGMTWTASVVVGTDEQGTVDVGAQPPLGGSFSDADPMGLVWRLAPTQKGASFFATPVDEGMTVAFTAVTQTPEPETADLVVGFAFGRDISAVDVSEDRFIGTLYEPLGDGQVGAVLVVPDLLPSATTAHPTAALLATQGYLALVVEYHDLPGTEPGITQIPLEVFVDALQWLGNHPRTTPDRVAAHAYGKGAEGLLAAVVRNLNAQPKAMIAVSPSCAVWQATAGGQSRPGSSWTWQGEPLPFLPIKQGNVIGQKLFRSVKKQDAGPLRLNLAHLEAFKDRHALQKTIIPADRFKGAMLLLAGNDDQVWPAGDMAELISRRRRKGSVGADDELIRFDRVGHLLRPPFLPTAVDRYLDDAGGGLVLGGEPTETLRASVTAWAKTLEFLRHHVG